MTDRPDTTASGRPAPVPPAFETPPSVPDAQGDPGHAPDDGHIRGALDGLITEAGRVVAWLVLVGAVISVYEVGMRYLLDSPTSWVHETTVFLISVIFALGGPIAMARDKHIRVRLIYDAVPPGARRWLDVLNAVITFVFLSGMTYAAWVMVWKATHDPSGVFQFERSGTSWNPPFPAWTKAAILFSVGLMLVQTLVHLVRALRGTDTPRTEG